LVIGKGKKNISLVASVKKFYQVQAKQEKPKTATIRLFEDWKLRKKCFVVSV
jgi:hypothetical protein